MLTELTKLASEKSAEKRLELMNVITDMFIKDTEVKSTNELELFGDVFTKLLSDMDEDGKLDISNKFARVDNTPKTFAVALIYEKAEIAAPMLEYSKVFDDDDLINVTNLTSTAHRIAIAKRRNVSATVTDTLIGHGEPMVLRTVCSNDSAHISKNGYSHMLKYNPDDGELLAILLQREDLPKDVKLLLPHLSGGVLKKVARVADAHSKAEMQQLISKTHQTREAEQQAEDLAVISQLDEVNQIRAGENTLNEIILRLANDHKVQQVATVFSEIEHLDLAYVNQIIKQKNGEALTVLCRSVELDDAAFKSICTMRETLLTLPLLAKAKMKNRFRDLAIADAKTKMRKIKLENSIKQKQQ